MGIMTVPVRTAILLCILCLCGSVFPGSAASAWTTEDLAARGHVDASADGPAGAGGVERAAFNSSPAGNASSRNAVPGGNGTQAADGDLSGAENIAPEAEFESSPEEPGPAPVTVEFDAAASGDSDGTIAEYAWDFGDGVSLVLLPSSGGRVSHLYTAPGDYVVTLVVTDDGGDAGTATATIAVPQGNDAPIVSSRTPLAGMRAPLPAPSERPFQSPAPPGNPVPCGPPTSTRA